MPKPTIVPAPNFNPLIDAEILQSAIGYINGNDDEVICVLCSRCNSQRQQIAEQYHETVGRDLEFELDSTLPGDFKALMMALCEPPEAFLAREVSRAAKAHKGNVIIEIFCTSTNAENAATKDAYRRMFETELQDDLREHTAFRSSPIFELLVSSERNEETQIDKEKINK
ncbi:annexin, partial [Aphelenchoides avenae]